ncbi:type II toxin-antitoxin system RelE/ParE family toxin [Pelovirga terrestris]|uniref:Type II toxin-antitoxin system RelE/ParE family toxin n=1 Tax=Pelovirga terrestris TaxID=2771352 RepID=A0A8J6UIY5_9BACT|nr:type II toxin-antitoxin system RelE/ParE family toxin [Pelovirga terrestris]MBD1401910.1 type II toxin-antitoxin system RelE/ParE family toxin [Pelovirga terrestris]
MSGWTVRLAAQAAQDVEDILDWTLGQFGPLQLENYTGVINDALEALNAGPQLIDVRRHPGLGDDVATLHVTRQGRKGRHLLVFRVDEQTSSIEVLRILHDSMDFERHLEQ